MKVLVQRASLGAALTLLLILFSSIMPAAAHDTFPVTVEHKFGSTTIPAEPQRVVAVGFSEQDTLLALGVTPIAVRYWYGDENNAIFPWAQDKLEGENPYVMHLEFGALNYEAILELAPDLIVATYSGITEDEYKLLSEIAPTIAQTPDSIDFGMSWQDTVTIIGAALGRSDEAAALVDEVDAGFQAVRDENPDFVGKSIVVAYHFPDEGFGFFTAQDPRGRFFTDLGFVIPDDLVEIAGESYYSNVSAERLELLDRDLLVFVGVQFADGGMEAILNDPLLSQLDVVKEGRVYFVPGALDDALQFSTVLSLPYLISEDGVVPELRAVLDAAVATPEA